MHILIPLYRCQIKSHLSLSLHTVGALFHHYRLPPGNTTGKSIDCQSVTHRTLLLTEMAVSPVPLLERVHAQLLIDDKSSTTTATTLLFAFVYFLPFSLFLSLSSLSLSFSPCNTSLVVCVSLCRSLSLSSRSCFSMIDHTNFSHINFSHINSSLSLSMQPFSRDPIQLPRLSLPITPHTSSSNSGH